MKKYLLKIILFILGIFIIDRLFIVFKYNDLNLFNEIARNKLYKIREKVDNSEYFDILIIGSSHAQFGISPEILMGNSDVKVLNLAFGGGANVSSQVRVLNKYLKVKNRKPKCIFYGIDVFALNFDPSVADFSQSILLEDKKSYISCIESKGLQSNIYLYSRFISDYYMDCLNGEYRFPYFRDSIKYDLSMFTNYRGYSISNLGFVSGYGLMNPNYYRYKSLNFDPNSESEKELRSFINICNQNNINIIFFQVPEFIGCSLNDLKYGQFNEYMSALAKENNVKYVDYNSISKFPINDTTLFFDTDHLNVKGAKLYSHILYDDFIGGKKFER